jgi:hypothetical protein
VRRPTASGGAQADSAKPAADQPPERRPDGYRGRDNRGRSFGRLDSAEARARTSSGPRTLVRLQPVSTTRSLRAPFLTLGGGFAAVVAAVAIGILLFAGAFDTGLTSPLGGLDERRPMRNDGVVERRAHERRARAAAHVRVARRSRQSAFRASAAAPPGGASQGSPGSPSRARARGSAAQSPGNSEVSPARPASPGHSGGSAGHQSASQGQGHAYGHSGGNGPQRSSSSQHGGPGHD